VNLSVSPELFGLRVLLIEDDAPLAQGIATALEQSGCRVAMSQRADDALTALDQSHHDLLILDLGLPDMDGLVLLEKIRAKFRRLPVLILSARDQTDDRVRGLDVGADDYLTKPFSLSELEARIRALARRTERQETARTLGDLAVELDTRRVWLRGEPLDLTKREAEVLCLLMQRPRVVVSKVELYDAAFPPESDVLPNALEVQISRIRQKLAGANVNVRSIRGLGYRIEESGRDGERRP